MSSTTITLPLRLYRGRNAADIDNQIAREVGLLSVNGADKPHRIIDAAINLERLRGQHDAVKHLENEFYQIVHWGVGQGWTTQQILLAQYDTLADLATRNPDDTASGRGGDGVRAYNDGRREVLAYVARELRRSDWFPGNELNTSNNDTVKAGN